MLPVRWIPDRRINRLERLMDRMVREPVEPFRFLPTLWDGRVRPALDVYETEENIVVKATLPGIKAEDVDVTVTGDTLVIKGDTHKGDQEKEEHYLLRERAHGTFHRAISLSREVDSGKVRADFQDGVLTVTLPKAERARTRKVEVAVKETAKAGK
ncbi:MAG: Hsp20/alpha crystallin family protein [Chloroflexi bacterium]|nr:Hsp20/alpha crystallin family protein [Chloroflexota bacterium]